MTQKTDFEDIKAKILAKIAKIHQACTEQYNRAYKSETFQELCSVIKDDFHWWVNNKVITSDLLIQYRKDFAQNDIFINISVQCGFLLCSNATVKALGNVTVEACDNATVEACDIATVEASGNATVKVYDNATVKAYGNTTVAAWGNATVNVYDNATVEAWGNTTVKAYDNTTVKAAGNATVKAYGKAKVKAYGNVYCTSYRIIECKLSNNAIYRVKSTNTVYYSSDNINFIKQ